MWVAGERTYRDDSSNLGRNLSLDLGVEVDVDADSSNGLSTCSDMANKDLNFGKHITNHLSRNYL